MTARSKLAPLVRVTRSLPAAAVLVLAGLAMVSLASSSSPTELETIADGDGSPPSAPSTTPADPSTSEGQPATVPTSPEGAAPSTTDQADEGIDTATSLAADSPDTDDSADEATSDSTSDTTGSDATNSSTTASANSDTEPDSDATGTTAETDQGSEGSVDSTPQATDADGGVDGESEGSNDDGATDEGSADEGSADDDGALDQGDQAGEDGGQGEDEAEADQGDEETEAALTEEVEEDDDAEEEQSFVQNALAVFIALVAVLGVLSLLVPPIWSLFQRWRDRDKNESLRRILWQWFRDLWRGGDEDVTDSIKAAPILNPIVMLDRLRNELESESDPRSAVRKAYSAVESGFGNDEKARHKSETPTAYLERVLGSITEGENRPLAQLTYLFLLARYSQHDITEAMRSEAIDAVVELRSRYREVEAVPV